MKKLFKALLVFACAGTLCAGALAMSACSGGVKGEAYGLTHKGDYIGYATVTVKGDKVTDCTLTEVELPSGIKDADKNLIYKEFAYGDVKLVYDDTASEYKVGDVSATQYFNSKEENCKAYYEAAVGNKITGKKFDDTTEAVSKSVLSKEDNGYWTRTDKDGNSYSRWKMNRDATVAYVKANGVAELNKLVKSATKVPDAKEDKEVAYWTDSNGVSTGATWSDLWYTTETAPAGYVTYAQLIVNAYNAAKK